MSHMPAHRSHVGREDHIHVVRGVVAQEHVYSVRTGKTTSITLREMWIRGEDGADWRVVGDAHCAAVRAGHRVEAVIFGADRDGHALRLRNHDTGSDRILLAMIQRLAGFTSGTAMIVGFLTLAVGFVVLFAVEALGKGTILYRYIDEIGFVALALPFPAAFATSAILTPGVRARRAWLRAHAERLPD
jgi:hypothetical protein